MALKTRLAIVNQHTHLTLRVFRVLLMLLTVKQVLAAEVKDECEYSKYVSTSESLEAAKKKLAPLVGKTFTTSRSGYRYVLGICASVLQEDKNSKAAVVQAEDMGNNKYGPPYIIGSLTDAHIIAGMDWLLLQYKSGNSYSNHCGNQNRTAMIMISCDETISDDASVHVEFVQEEKSKTSDCFYLFEMKHKAVCPVASPAGLSIGSILVIMFFTFVSVYLIVGFFYQRFVHKAKGMEQIPNYYFWQDFGNLQADGCNFICRSKDYSRPRSIGGLGDDQLDHTEELRDDNLLPM